MTRKFLSYPKSGRTWVRYMLHELGSAEGIHFSHDGFEFNDGDKPPHDFSIERRLIQYRKVDRIVFLKRDPRDNIVSLYHQVTGRFADFFHYQGTISDFLRDDYFGADVLRRFLEMWDDLGQLENVLTVTYEDLKTDTVANLRRVLEHFEIQPQDTDVLRAVEAGRLGNMRKLEDAGTFSRPWLRRRQGASKVRSGVVGSHRAELSEEDASYLNSVFGLAPWIEDPNGT